MERLIFAALVALALFGLAEAGAAFHPLALAAEAIGSAGSCGEGWSPEACEAAR